MRLERFAISAILVGSCLNVGCGTAVEPSADEALVRSTDSAADQTVDEPADWLGLVKATISNGAYRVRAAAIGFEATNQAHDLKAELADHGVKLTSRTDAAKGEISLRFVGWGRGGRDGIAEDVMPTLGRCSKQGRLDEFGRCLQRLEFLRGAITEWWDNEPEGVEQAGRSRSDRLAAAH